ncbi:MAG: DUF2939 domain-containing protein [Alphaproteobacteria bacterium]|nr:DUF2939 domain-containing protein [Alphaproteobacteria bacterium]MBU1514260.1 DUF2939 domain-containing protein [Alphaproteobacteria bacterium]MBU2093294.1 DUF2939 domain-containing protein [Alphaproteobacteria bacterium]MBU2152418.1 DUF2939 domain-containing protein [Alphaproteobacteria bacterium]MBU2309031.1 DUF2939 domain-containing protein [Alphaproteobacteria bacterium]
MRAIVIALLALTLSACATVQKLEAAGDVHALLISIRDGDSATFDSLVDRRALKREIQARLVTEASRDSRVPAGLAAILAPGLAELAGETLVQPQVFRSVAEYYGYRQDMKIPGPIGISTMLRQMPDGRVCAVTKKDGPCLLVFAEAPDGRWKLSGFEGDLKMLRLKR